MELNNEEEELLLDLIIVLRANGKLKE